MNQTYSTYALDTGLFTGYQIVCDPDSLDINVPTGCSALLGEYNHLTQCVQLSDHTVIDYVPPAPTNDDMKSWSWDTTAKVWKSTPTLRARRATKWAEIKAQKAALDTGSFTFEGNVYQIDKPNITGAVVDAMIAKAASETYSEPWLLTNNTVVVLNADQMIALGRAMKAYVTNLVVIGETLRAQIDSATEPEAITWPT